MASLLGLQNTMRGRLRAYGLKVGEVHRNRFGDRIRELLREQPLLEVVIGPLLRATKLLVAERSRLDIRQTQAANGDAVCKRLMTIPGVGPITSLAFRATVDDPTRFQVSKLVGAHFGLTPKVYQLGKTDRSGNISKAGDHLMRHLLYEAASSLMTRCRKHSRLRAWGIAVARRRGSKKARVAVARKLAVIMHRMWVFGTAFVFGGEASVPVAA